MEFKVGDKVMLNESGLRQYGERHVLARGATVTYVGRATLGDFVGWASNCGGCYFFNLQLMEGPW